MTPHTGQSASNSGTQSRVAAASPPAAAAPVDDDDYGTGYRRVNSTMACVVTRFRMKSLLGVIGCYRHYRRIRAASRRQTGLLAALFAFDDTRTCYTISIWSDDEAILRFNTESSRHIRAGNWLAGRLDTCEGRPELWSAKFSLQAIGDNLQWHGVDTRATLRAAEVRGDES
jgi:hypothetical protein